VSIIHFKYRRENNPLMQQMLVIYVRDKYVDGPMLTQEESNW
jgi:hypothetical protein